jgi:hypothetical protein
MGLCVFRRRTLLPQTGHRGKCRFLQFRLRYLVHGIVKCARYRRQLQGCFIWEIDVCFVKSFREFVRAFFISSEIFLIQKKHFSFLCQSLKIFFSYGQRSCKKVVAPFASSASRREWEHYGGVVILLHTVTPSGATNSASRKC